MSVVQIKDKKFELYIPGKEIQRSVRATADKITKDLHTKNPLFICVLNGAFFFMSDLMKVIDFPCEIAFIRLKSYSGTNSSGDVKEILGLSEDLKGRNVVIVEDIIDTGNTLQYLCGYLRSFSPDSLSVATFLKKHTHTEVNIRTDYVAMEIPDYFVVGYGLDYDGYGRNLNDLYKIKE